MTGRAMFNEVFLSDARVSVDALIGGESNGWRVANTTLTIERSGLGSGTVAVATAQCGTVAGNLERRAGDFRSRRGRWRPGIGTKAVPDARRTRHEARPSRRPVGARRAHEAVFADDRQRLQHAAGQGRTGTHRWRRQHWQAAW